MAILNRTSLSLLDKAHLIEQKAHCQAKYSITAFVEAFSISRKSHLLNKLLTIRYSIL